MASSDHQQGIQPPDPRVTQFLQKASEGDAEAADELLEAVYDELRKLARAKLAREKPGQTIQATALVHEAYLRLMGDDTANWSGRGHFFAAAAEAMRRILVEQARRKAALKHGSDRRQIVLKESFIATNEDGVDLVALSAALDRLHEESPDKAALVKLRYFTGLTIPQAAQALGISHATAERWWTYSRLRLFQWLGESEESGS